MTYRQFKQVILLTLKKAGIPATGARFQEDRESGIFVAFASGIKFIGNPRSKEITTRWGAGHLATFNAADFVVA